MSGMGPRRNSTMELFQEGQDADIEYFFASDASAIIEHTNRVIYLEVRGSFKIVPGCLSPDFLTHQFVSQFSQHWNKKFKNRFLYRVSPEHISEIVNYFLRYADSGGTRYKSPFLNILSQY